MYAALNSEESIDFEGARQAVRADLASQLDACVVLRDFAASLGPPWAGRPLDPYARPHETLLIAIVARSVNTYCSVIELVQAGFGPQAAMLNRPLFEDLVDAHWITINADIAVALAARSMASPSPAAPRSASASPRPRWRAARARSTAS